jgi:hypothetical protein
LTSDQTSSTLRAQARLSLAGRLLRIGIAILWTLVAAEFFLRIFAPVPMLPRYVVATDYGIRGNQPSSVYTHSTPDYTVEIRTNAQGFRADHEIAIPKPPGVKRIVVLGDSFGMGYGVNLEDTFITQLEERLGPDLGPIETVNLSVSGHGNAEQLIALREVGLAFEPDLVLLAWHRTDLSDNIRSGLFKLREEGLVRKNKTFLPSVEVREFLFSFAAYRWLAGSSHLYNFLREQAGELAKGLLGTLRAITSAPPSRAAAPAVEVSPSSLPGPIAEERPYPDRLTLALLETVQDEARGQGAELLVLDIPNTRGRTRFDSSFPETVGTPLEGRLHVVSPLEDFRAHPGRLIYWERSHFHLTPFGCDLVGDRIAEYVRAHSLLAGGASE